MKRVIVLFFVFNLFLNCSSQKKSSVKVADAKMYQVIYKSFYTGAKNKSYRLLKNFEDYKSLLLSLPVVKIQGVDFNSNNVLVLNIGSRESQVFRMIPEKVYEDNDKIIIVLKKEFPQKDLSKPKAEFYPITIVKINSKKEVVLQ